ncbi:MAG: toxin RelE [Firmicutes bacterium]|nr:toxin RelE [Bacillota bacterium]
MQISDQAIKELKKLDRVNRELIFTYIEQRIEGCENPRLFGEPLKENLSGYWRYRIGQYRLICEIDDAVVTVYVVAVGHRKQVYNR